jgi:formiminotetrahydrofolate cyclodeaminase
MSAPQDQRPAGAAGYLDMPLREFLGALAAAEPAPSGGGAAALSVSLGASLCAMTAGLSARQLSAGTAQRLAAQARRLCDAAASLIQADAQSYEAVLAARREGSAGIAGALAEAAAVPMQIVELAAAVARLAADLAASATPQLRGDAITAVLLAEAGARAGAALVHINLAGAPADGRPARAGQILRDIAGSARAALSSAELGSAALPELGHAALRLSGAPPDPATSPPSS